MYYSLFISSFLPIHKGLCESARSYDTKGRRQKCPKRIIFSCSCVLLVWFYLLSVIKARQISCLYYSQTCVLRSPLKNGKVTVIYKVTAIYICRKYRAIENFGKLSGDRYIQGRYIQVWIYLICTGVPNGKFWDNKAWIKFSEAILSILGNCWEKCICSSLPVKLMKEFPANKVHLQPAIWLTEKFSSIRMSRPY